MSTSVYNSPEYRSALTRSGSKVIEISQSFIAVEREISLPALGKKKILEARGTPSAEEASLFRKSARSYFYGLIAPTVTDSDFSVFTKHSYKKVSNHTILINLSLAKDQLWQALEKKSSRWGVKTAEKNGLQFQTLSMESLDIFYELYASTASTGGFAPESKEFIKAIIEKKTVATLVGVVDGKELVAGGLVLFDKQNNYSILDLTASSAKGLDKQAMPFLYWNIILLSKEKGFAYLDLGGYDQEARESEKTYKINKFKDRFGGTVREQPIYATNWKYPFLRGILKKFRFLRKSYNKE